MEWIPINVDAHDRRVGIRQEVAHLANAFCSVHAIGGLGTQPPVARQAVTEFEGDVLKEPVFASSRKLRDCLSFISQKSHV
jgi:hypothetical protein